jgi:hypothetical protein
MRINRTAFASALILAASLVGTTTGPVQAAYVLTLEQEGPNVVATGSGTLDLAALSFFATEVSSPSINPTQLEILTGATASFDVYETLTPPVAFGSGGFTAASAGSGDFVGVDDEALAVPAAYVSGFLSGSATFDDATLASLGVTPGVYVWTWGSGPNADSFTLDVEAVPEPSTWAMMLIGFAGLGFAGYRASRGLPRSPHRSAARVTPSSRAPGSRR